MELPDHPSGHIDSVVRCAVLFFAQYSVLFAAFIQLIRFIPIFCARVET